MYKKVLAIFLAALMLLTAFAGCARTAEQPSENTPPAVSQSSTEEREIVPITLMSLGIASWGDDFDNTIVGTPLYDEIIKNTGVELHVVGLDGDQSQIHIASNDLGDIIQIVGDANQLNSLYVNKQIIPLNDLVKQYAPHIMTDFPGRWEWCCNAVADDPGTAWTLAVNAGSSGPNIYFGRQLFSVRWDLYKKLGYPKITDIDSYLDVVVKMLELQPKTATNKKVYGVSFYGNGGVYGLNYIFQGTYGYHNKLAYISENLADHTMCYEFTDEKSPLWRSIEFYNKAYRLGILDPDSFTQTQEDYNAKIVTGEILCGEDTNYLHQFSNNQFEADPESEAVVVSLPVKGTWSYANMVSDGWGLAFCDSINAKCKYPERAMELIGWLFSYEGSRAGWSGAKGVDWDYNDDGEAVFTEHFYNEVANGNEKPPYSSVSCMANWVGIQAGTYAPDGSYVGLRCGDDYISRTKMLPGYKDYCGYFDVAFPGAAFTKAVDSGELAGDLSGVRTVNLGDSSEDIARIEEALNTYFTENYPDAITAADDQAFAAAKAVIIAKLVELGADKARDFWQTRWDSAAAN